MNRLITITIIIMALFLLPACSPVQTPIHTKSPTIIPSKTLTTAPTVLPSNTPSSTPTITKTPESSAIQSLRLDANLICNDIFQGYDSGIDYQRWSFGFEPSTAAFINVDYENSDWELTDLLATATAVEQVNSIICIKQTRIDQGSYTNGGRGYQLMWDTWLVKWPDGQLLSNRLFSGGPPPATVQTSGNHYGSTPEEEVNNWLASLRTDPYFTTDSPITHLAFSKDGETLIVGTNKNISFLQAANGEVNNVFPISELKSRKIVYSQDNTRVAVSICLSIENQKCTQSEVRVIEIYTSNTLFMAEGLTPDTYALAISSDGRTLATRSAEIDVDDGSSTSTVYLWDIDSGRSILAIPDIPGSPSWILFTPDGSGLLYDNNRYNNVELRDTKNGEIINSYARGDVITAQAFSPLSNLAVLGSGGNCLQRDCSPGYVEVFDFSTGTTQWVLPEFESRIDAVAFSPDGSHLAVSSCAQRVFLLFDQTLLPICAAGKVTIWDLKVQSILHTIYPSTTQIDALVYTPDQSALVTGDAGGEIRIWELSGE